MISKDQVKKTAFDCGADLFGVASIDRFGQAPEGFHPRDVYSRTESVIVIAIRLPSETLFAENPVPYTHMNTLAMRKMDSVVFSISSKLDRMGLKNVLIPTDDPYLHWNEALQEGRAILSLRHAGVLAGLGKLGRNNLLINRTFGSMIQIGALLTSEKYESDPFADYEVCREHCGICIANCPRKALTGETVIQKNCRPLSNCRTDKGFNIKKCFECRKLCPSVLGVE